MNKYKVKNNLFVIGDKVISYETHVATIKGDKLIEGGKWSHTTSKHVRLVGRLLGLQVVDSKKQKCFYELPFGAKCSVGKDVISPETTKKIFNLLRQGQDYILSIASLKNEIPKKEWDILKGAKTIQERLVKGVDVMKRFDCFVQDSDF